MPAASDLAKLCRTVEQAEGNSYVHCANGHGRSTMLVAMIMIRRGDRYTY
jgi:protein-tyrosine phosphatase